jgi:hypothetical protein
VQVALDPAPFGVLGGDQALAGRRQLVQPLAELGGERDLVMITSVSSRFP